MDGSNDGNDAGDDNDDYGDDDEMKKKCWLITLTRMMMSGNINSWDWGTPSNNYALAPLTRQGQFINRSSHLVFIIHDETI